MPEAALSPTDAIFLRRFGDLGLIRNEWPIIAHAENWELDTWPMPPFISFDEETGRALKISLDDDFQIASKEECSPSLRATFLADVDSGYGAVEIHLTKILGGGR